MDGEKRAQAQNGLRNAWRRQGKPYTLSCESAYAVPRKTVASVFSAAGVARALRLGY